MSEKKAVKLVAEGVARFDASRLPKQALLDTTVWLRAFGWASDHDNICRDFYEAMLAHSRRMILTAPTIAELMRGDRTRAMPRHRGIVQVAFTPDAGRKLGSIAPDSWLKTFEAGTGERSYVKYDVLIAVAGKEAGADCMVSLDEGGPMRSICQAVGLPRFKPKEFITAQSPLALGDVASVKPESK